MWKILELASLVVIAVLVGYSIYGKGYQHGQENGYFQGGLDGYAVGTEVCDYLLYEDEEEERPWDFIPDEPKTKGVKF
jgi:hypothetical protein